MRACAWAAARFFFFESPKNDFTKTFIPLMTRARAWAAAREPNLARDIDAGVTLWQTCVRGLGYLAAIRFAQFFSFRFRTRPRTFYGASERFAKPS